MRELVAVQLVYMLAFHMGPNYEIIITRDEIKQLCNLCIENNIETELAIHDFECLSNRYECNIKLDIDKNVVIRSCITKEEHQWFVGSLCCDAKYMCHSFGKCLIDNYELEKLWSKVKYNGISSNNSKNENSTVIERLKNEISELKNTLEKKEKELINKYNNLALSTYIETTINK